jgi:hypothetical protein
VALKLINSYDVTDMTSLDKLLSTSKGTSWKIQEMKTEITAGVENFTKYIENMFVSGSYTVCHSTLAFLSVTLHIQIYDL